MLIVITGIVWLFSIFSESQKLSNSTEQRIQAIQIAREWIEAFENIRDTNWLLFAADYQNCWNVRDYNRDCFWRGPTAEYIEHLSRSTMQRDANNRWVLSPVIITLTNDEFTDSWYRNDFRVQKSGSWFYLQWWWGIDFLPIFTREILVEYIDTGTPIWADNQDQKIKVTSIVQWNDSSSDVPRKIELVTELTNWEG